MPVVGLVVLAVAGGVGWWLWWWIDGLALDNPVDKDRATARLDAVKIAASVAVGGGGLFALYLAALRQRTQEDELKARHAELAQRDRAQDDTRADAEARRITELYAKSAEQLGSDKAPVRLAGLYALERLAQDNPDRPDLRQTVVNVLCAYLRMPYTLPGAPPAEDADETLRARHDERWQEQQVRLTAQRVLRDHLRPGDDLANPRPPSGPTSTSTSPTPP
uniref:hypothetical protein n=1 Tax=Saccharothrix espanaensis TaxID=103731 RepID=UPI003F49077F